MLSARMNIGTVHSFYILITNCLFLFLTIFSTTTICTQSGKACLGDSIYHYMCTADQFSPDHLLDCLNMTSEHEALELADRVEASMYTWRRKACLSNSKSSWDLVKDLMAETDRSDKNHVLAERADSLLFCLKQRYPELSQTTLDTSKIQCNKVSLWPSINSYESSLESQ